LGISPQAVKVYPRATFDLMLYRFDPAWGFRDVIARHRALQPEAYPTDLPLYPLGLTDPASAAIADLATGQPVAFTLADGNIIVRLTLGPWQTRVLQVSGGVTPPTPMPTLTATPTPTPTATPNPRLYLPSLMKGDNHAKIS